MERRDDDEWTEPNVTVISPAVPSRVAAAAHERCSLWLPPSRYIIKCTGTAGLLSVRDTVPLGATLNRAYSAGEGSAAELMPGVKAIWLQVQLLSALSGDWGERGVERGSGAGLRGLVGRGTAFI